MSRPKRKQTLQKDQPSKAKTQTADGVVTGPEYPTEEIKWWREAVEGLVIAVVLALLIRGFEAEAFVIPTGSMAPTLRGRHKDVVCDQCQHQYAAGASLDAENRSGKVIGTTCPMCAFPKDINYDKSRDASFTGDRILVNKFAYDLMGEPERFDVIVFKNPNNAKQNYIKRLCGLPGEKIRLFRGDIYVGVKGSNENYQIARKPPRKLRAMLQLVHDTKYIPSILDEAGLPPRWQVQPAAAWSTEDKNRTFDISASPAESWLRYRHITPNLREWQDLINNNQANFGGTRGQLISDFYGYNTHLNQAAIADPTGMSAEEYFDRSAGKNWVGDLAVECDLNVKSDDGELLLDLVEGGWHFGCAIDVSSGQATLTINGGADSFKKSNTVQGRTRLKGAGRYRVFFSNADDELRLWVNNKLVTFEETTTYGRRDSETFRPVYNGEDDPADLAPIGVGARNLEATVKRLRVHRDKYYVAVKDDGRHRTNPTMGDYRESLSREGAEHIQRSPELWADSPVFERPEVATFVLEDSEDDAKDQFFPMGDNSPQSHDARVWHSSRNYVERQYLIGEAVLIYYPHPWHVKLPGSGVEDFKSIPLIFYPKFSRMGLIH